MTGKVVNLGSKIHPHDEIGWTLRFRLGFCLELTDAVEKVLVNIGES
jgi:hypothetical protein